MIDKSEKMNSIIEKRIKEREGEFTWIRKIIYDFKKKKNISEAQVKERISSYISNIYVKEKSPYYLENKGFREYLDKLDDFYNTNYKSLDETNQWLLCQIFLIDQISVALLSTASICSILNSTAEGDHPSLTNTKMLLGRALISVQTNPTEKRDLESFDEKKISLEKNKELIMSLGDFLYCGLVESGIVILDKKYLLLSLNAEKILQIVRSTNFTHPSLFLYEEFSEKKKYYSYCSGTFYEMIHLKDSTNVRRSSIEIGDQCYETINYLQSRHYYIQQSVLDIIKKNLLSEFIDFSEEQEPLCLKFEERMDLVKYKQDNNDITDLENLKNKWNTSNTKLNKFIDIIIFASVYSYTKIYFRAYYCWRGRIYFQNYPLSPQGPKIVRRLLSFLPDKELVGIDVSGSGFQMIGLLSNCYKTLCMTKFFDSDSTDIYEFNMQKFVESIEKDENLSQYVKLFDRKFYKEILMCKVYSEKSYTRSIKIRKKFFETYGKKPTMTELMLISKRIVEIYEIENPLLAEFEKDIQFVVKKIMKDKISVFIGASNHFISLSIYPKQESKIITYKNFISKKMKRVTLKLDILPLKNNASKTRSSIIPNFVHNLDSMVLSSLVLKAKKANIDLYTVHDCFFVDPIFAEKIKDYYYESAIEVFSSNPFVTFMIKNDVRDEKIEKKYSDYTEAFIKSLENNKRSKEILK